MRLPVLLDVDDSGQWTATAAALDGAAATGAERDEALRRLQALALRALADRVERGEPLPDVNPFEFDVSEGQGVRASRERLVEALERVLAAPAASGAATSDDDDLDAAEDMLREIRRGRRSGAATG